MMNNFRRVSAWNKRDEANQLANQRPHPRHITNGEEQKFRHGENTEVTQCHEDEHSTFLQGQADPTYTQILNISGKPSYLMSFTKGMPHNKTTGLLNDPQNFQYFVRAIDSGDPRDFRDTPLGPEAHIGKTYNCSAPDASKWLSEKAKTGDDGKPVGGRAWESQSAGLAFELEGPDAQAVTMPPAPPLGSDELTAEMAEIYVQALLRDTPFNAMSTGVVCSDDTESIAGIVQSPADVTKIKHLTNELNTLDWFKKSACDLCLDQPAKARHRGAPLNPGNAFRGITPGDDIGPYLSQFLLIGNTGINGRDNERSVEDGLISYGAISVDQRVRTATPEKDYMTIWEEWIDVQHAANLGGLEEYLPKNNINARRFIYTPRDLATYVHYDALYEAYLNACLILLGTNTPFDPGIPFQEDDSRDHQQGFAHFGGPHILSLVTEVATRALKAVRFQKYNVHRRCRPEVLAARLAKAELLEDMAPELGTMTSQMSGILKKVEAHNNAQNSTWKRKTKHKLKTNYLLPMAFCEGSPMHPAYGAGHATVAGACVTILKAFFDSKRLFKPNGTDANQAYISVLERRAHYPKLKLIPVVDQSCKEANLTIEGELNKLASNISIGRNWAGVHYFTDYYESLLMGEQIALGILEEQKVTYGENFSMTVPLFDGTSIRI